MHHFWKDKDATTLFFSSQAKTQLQVNPGMPKQSEEVNLCQPHFISLAQNQFELSTSATHLHITVRLNKNRTPSIHKNSIRLQVPKLTLQKNNLAIFIGSPPQKAPFYRPTLKVPNLQASPWSTQGWHVWNDD